MWCKNPYRIKKSEMVGLLIAAFIVASFSLICLAANYYRILWGGFNQGGGVRSSATYKLKDTIGQPIIGISQSLSFSIRTGSGAIFSAPPEPFPSHLEGVIVYPNPFDPSRGHNRIVFDNLTEDAKIRIFTISGRLVNETQVSGHKNWAWDVKTKDGGEVARGIYIYLITNAAGQKKTGKIAVLR